MSKRLRDWPLIFGAILGACFGAFVVGYWATQEFRLYSYQIPSVETFKGMTPLERIASLSSLHKVYNWSIIAAWASVGAGIGSIGGTIILGLLHFLHNPKE